MSCHDTGNAPGLELDWIADKRYHDESVYLDMYEGRNCRIRHLATETKTAHRVARKAPKLHLRRFKPPVRDVSSLMMNESSRWTVETYQTGRTARVTSKNITSHPSLFKNTTCRPIVLRCVHTLATQPIKVRAGTMSVSILTQPYIWTLSQHCNLARSMTEMRKGIVPSQSSSKG